MHRRFQTLAVKWFVPAVAVLIGLLAAQNGLAAEPAGQPHVYKSVGGQDLVLYVTRPPGWRATDRRPAILFFHGGSWRGGAPGQFTHHATYLASRGMVAVQVQYRLLDKASSEPPTACVQDARSAMRWVRSRADELGIDPDRIASAGGSAGGHLAASLGMIEGHDDPEDDLSVPVQSNAMVLFNPIIDVSPDGWQPGYERVGDRYPDYSPIHNIGTGTPPAVMFFGTEDTATSVATIERFRLEMHEAGVRCDVVMFEGMEHGFFNHTKHDGQPFYETLLATDVFLTSLGWLDGPPTLETPARSTADRK
ncbi:MAG: alpha/beta hydrolase [Planctomycetota bacterium]